MHGSMPRSKFFLQYALDFSLYLCLHQRDWKTKPGFDLQLTGREGDGAIDACTFERQAIIALPVANEPKP